MTWLNVGCLTATGVVLFALPLDAQQINFGAIEVTSEPSDAAVYLEGFLVGRTPVTAQQLSPGDSYRLVIKKDSYDDLVKDVSVIAGEIANVAVELVPDSGAWRSAVRQEDDWKPILKDQERQYKNAKSTRSLRSYDVLEVSNFLIKSDETVPLNQRYSLLQHLARQLDKRTSFNSLVTSYTPGPSRRWSAAGGGSSEATAVLSGVITYYRPGSRLRRTVLGILVDWGQNDTRIQCLLRVTDRATNEVVLERLAKGAATGIASAPTATRNLASNIAKAVARNW